MIAELKELEIWHLKIGCDKFCCVTDLITLLETSAEF